MVDSSDPNFRTHIRVTEHVLETIGAGDIPSLLVLNKSDRLAPEERAAIASEFTRGVLMNALDVEDGSRLSQRIADHFDRHLETGRFSIPYSKQGILASFRDQVRVASEEYGSAIEVTAAGTPATMGRPRKMLS